VGIWEVPSLPWALLSRRTWTLQELSHDEH
jgi:hypothetical protein